MAVQRIILVPKMKKRRSMLLCSAVYNSRLYPEMFRKLDMSLWKTPRERVMAAQAIMWITRPIDPAGRMDEKSLRAWNRAFNPSKDSGDESSDSATGKSVTTTIAGAGEKGVEIRP